MAGQLMFIGNPSRKGKKMAKKRKKTTTTKRRKTARKYYQVLIGGGKRSSTKLVPIYRKKKYKKSAARATTTSRKRRTGGKRKAFTLLRKRKGHKRHYTVTTGGQLTSAYSNPRRRRRVRRYYSNPRKGHKKTHRRIIYRTLAVAGGRRPHVRLRRYRRNPDWLPNKKQLMDAAMMGVGFVASRYLAKQMPNWLKSLTFIPAGWSEQIYAAVVAIAIPAITGIAKIKLPEGIAEGAMVNAAYTLATKIPWVQQNAGLSGLRAIPQYTRGIKTDFNPLNPVASLGLSRYASGPDAVGGDGADYGL